MNNELILKCDGDNAIASIRDAVSKKHGTRITPEQPPRGEHQANGVMEEVGRSVRAMARVLRIQLDDKIDGAFT